MSSPNPAAVHAPASASTPVARHGTPRGRRRTTTRVLVIALSATLLGGIVACSPGDEGPRQAVERFLAAYSRNDIDAAAGLTDNPAAARTALADAWSGLSAAGMSYRTGAADISGDTADIDVTYRWQLPRGREWSYPATVKATRSTPAGASAGSPPTSTQNSAPTSVCRCGSPSRHARR
ncbi:hypothetical protein GCM10009624_08950 [Gordonia sinesedis]